MGSFRTKVERAYRRLLRLYPEDFRDEWGEEMQLLFSERSRGEPLHRLAADVLLDLVKTAPKEHLDMLRHDLTAALRSMRKSPAFTLVAAGSLALGIGGSAAIFSLADALVLRPLPVPRAGELMAVRSRDAGSPLGADYESMSYLDFRDLKERSRSFAGLAAHETLPMSLGPEGGADVPRLTLGMEVSGSFFDVLGVPAARGRTFLPEEDDVPGRNPVAVLSDRAWRASFGADPSIVGRTVRVNGRSLTVVGIAPETFTGLDLFVGTDVYVPIAMAAELRGEPGSRLLTRRDERMLGVKGRLKPGVSLKSAAAELSAIAARLEKEHPDTNAGRGVSVRTEISTRFEIEPANAAIVGMLVLLVALVLLIACANVATLLLARAASRERELAIRLAVGASRARLVRQLLTESLALAIAGGALGLLVAYGGIRFFSTFRLPLDFPVVMSFRLDGRVLAVSLVLSVASVLLFGVAPAVKSARADLVPALKGAAGDGAGRLRGRRALVAAEVALAVVVLTCAANLMAGFSRLLGGDAGFRKTGLLTAALDPTVLRMPTDRAHAMYRELVERVRALPGVRSVSLTSGLPMGNGIHVVSYLPEGFVPPKGVASLSTLGAVVDESYFDTFGVAVVRGRPFRASDDEKAPRVVIVNEELARHRWPGENPLGKRLRLEPPDGAWAEVVGVARTHKYTWIGEAPGDYAYLPFAQSDRRRMTILVEAAAGDAAALAAPLRGAVRAVSPDLPVNNVRTIEDFYALRAVSIPDLLVKTVGGMGLSGLALAVVGLYALVAYSVSRRTREIGIRMAIGASARDVVRMVLRQGLGLTAAGLVAGLLAALGVLRLVSAAVWGMGSPDPLALLVPAALLLAVTVAATLGPARRAARVSPTIALRSE